EFSAREISRSDAAVPAVLAASAAATKTSERSRPCSCTRCSIARPAASRLAKAPRMVVTLSSPMACTPSFRSKRSRAGIVPRGGRSLRVRVRTDAVAGCAGTRWASHGSRAVLALLGHRVRRSRHEGVDRMAEFIADLGGTRYVFAGLAELLAAASPPRSGDELAGIA